MALDELSQPNPGPRGARQPAGPPRGGGCGTTPVWRKRTDRSGSKRRPPISNARTIPGLHCQTTSIVFDWTFDGPVNRITQNRDSIVIEYGQFGLKRTVYLNLKDHPASFKPSRAGHSIGRWEGDTLVVDTVGFLAGYLSTPVRNSDKLHVVERFSLDTSKMSLTRSYSAEDPVYLKGRYSGSDSVLVADAPFNPGKCQELNFIDYSKQQPASR